MLKNYFKIALRSLVRNKTFTLINIVGLVMGISFSTMLYTYVNHELSYDSFHKKADRTFRVLTTDKSSPDNVRTYGFTTPPMGPELLSSFPEIKEMTRLYRLSGQVIVEIEESKYNERKWFTTSDSNFFEVFDFDLIEGNKKTALIEPYSVILTESTAKKYFPDQALGKIIKTSFGEAKVTGIIKDFPGNSHLQFDLLFSSIRSGPDWESYLTNWKRFGAYTYIVLHEGASIQEVEEKTPALTEKFIGPDSRVQATQFQPIQNIYLHSENIEAGVEEVHGEPTYIYIFSSMSIFLLIIAAINYINLATSKASTRAKEIGLRKVVGAYKSQLVIQFLTEALVITLLSMILSLGVIDLCLPLFNSITGKSFDLTFDSIGMYAGPLVFNTLLIGLLAGSYPAFYLSRLKPIVTMKGQHLMSRKGFDLRAGLVVFQFTITIVLMVSTLVISDQISFIRTKDLGFDKDQIMVIDINSRAARSQFQAMKNEFSALSGVKEVAVSSQVPGEWKALDEVYVMRTNDNSATADSLHTYFMGFDEDMMAAYNLRVVSGNFFSGKNEGDSLNVLINHSAAKAMNLENPIGSRIRVSGYGIEWEANVIGVLQDFNFQSLHQKIAPIVIAYRNNPIASIDYFSLKISGKDISSVISEATKIHEKFDTQTPIEYHFLSDQLDRFYGKETKAGQIFNLAGVLSIVVACLGLLGLATYNVERKTKELGIRKLLGASPVNLFLMLSNSFIKNVLLAFIIACPLAWYIMTQWLSVFEYRIDISPVSFVLSGIFIFVVVLVTIFYQSVKAALNNPIESLKQD